MKVYKKVRNQNSEAPFCRADADRSSIGVVTVGKLTFKIVFEKFQLTQGFIVDLTGWSQEKLRFSVEKGNTIVFFKAFQIFAEALMGDKKPGGCS